MKRADLTILLALVGVGLVAVFWFMLLAPKREEAAKLGDEVAELEASVATAQDDAAYAESARKDYDRNYHQLTVLGQAVPDDSDTPSLLVELQTLADRSKVSFDGLALSETAEIAAAPETPAAPAPGGAAPSGESAPPGGAPAPPAGSSGSAPAPAPAPTASGESAATPASTATPAPTEATAATLPLGAAIGPAGLPTMPYDLTFSGGYFEVADFFGSVDDLVHTRDDKVGVDGRLLTVDGFTLATVEDSAAAPGTFDLTPDLNVTLATTTYLTPAEQGLVAGADPTAPAATTPVAPTPTSTTTPAP